MNLAHPNFGKFYYIDLLIGVDHISEILLSNANMRPGNPIIWPTIFGEVILGKLPIEASDNQKNTVHSHFSTSLLTSNEKLSHMLTKFWES